MLQSQRSFAIPEMWAGILLLGLLGYALNLLGVRHGLFFVGCCWSLMVLMFLVGLGNLFWMLMLGIVMAVFLPARSQRPA